MERVKKWDPNLASKDIIEPIYYLRRPSLYCPEEKESLISVEFDFIIGGQHWGISGSWVILQDWPQNVNCCLIKLIIWNLILSPVYNSKASGSCQTVFFPFSWTHFEPSLLWDFALAVYFWYTGSLQPHPISHFIDQNKSFVFWDHLSLKDNHSQALVGTRIMCRNQIAILIWQVWGGA